MKGFRLKHGFWQPKGLGHGVICLASQAQVWTEVGVVWGGLEKVVVAAYGGGGGVK